MGKGRAVTDAQVKELRHWLHQGASLFKAAMKSGMDPKTARKYRRRGKLPSESQQPHVWRTRIDPLATVWPRLEELLQGAPGLQAKTLLEQLQREYPDQDWERCRRTLERRVRVWKGQHGPEHEVFFAQVHDPGRLGSSDFSHMDHLGVTIQGQPFSHLIYHFVLTYSNWEYVQLCFSESFASLSAGLQNALWTLGLVPQRHRTDRMTLAVNKDGNPEEFTANYRALLGHYGVVGEATNAYSGHENGDCEQGHRRFKEAVAQALMLRANFDFASREDYERFLREIVEQRNARRQKKFVEELAHMNPLPARRLETLQRQRIRVGRGSAIQVLRNGYSVPARLIGEQVEARIGAEEIEVWYGGELVQRMERQRGQGKHKVDYRHVIEWLARKPGAFARYVYREDMYPTATYRRVYDALVASQPGRAEREYLHILRLAAREGEAQVEAALLKLLDQRQPLSEQAVQTLLGNDTPLSAAARVQVLDVDLGQYDTLLDYGNDADNTTIGISDKEYEMLPEQRCVRKGDDKLLAFGSEPDRDPKRIVKTYTKESNNEQGCQHGIAEVFAGTAPADDAVAARGGGPASDRAVVGLCSLPAGVGATGVSAAPTQPHRTALEGVAVTAGEKLVGPGPETFADEGGAAVARTAERRLCRSTSEYSDVRSSGSGQDACLVRGGSGTGADGPTGIAYEVQSAGPGSAGGETRSGSEGIAETVGELGGIADRRPRLCGTEPRGNGSLIHAAGGALRTGECAGDEQSAVLEVGADLQGSDDHRGGDRPAGASQCDRGVERAELPCRGGQESETSRCLTKAEAGNSEVPGWGPGVAPVAVAALRLPTPRQAPTPQSFPEVVWGNIIVGEGER
jgi:hypothetical protein